MVKLDFVRNYFDKGIKTLNIKCHVTSISMKAKPGGLRATHTSRTRPILEKASSRSNLIKCCMIICLAMAASKVMQNFTPHQSADFKKTPDIWYGHFSKPQSIQLSVLLKKGKKPGACSVRRLVVIGGWFRASEALQRNWSWLDGRKDGRRLGRWLKGWFICWLGRKSEGWWKPLGGVVGDDNSGLLTRCSRSF